MVSAAEKASLIHFLRHDAGLTPKRNTQSKVAVYSVKSTVQVLLSKRYVLACSQSTLLPGIRNQNTALELLDTLRCSGVIVTYPSAPKIPWYKRVDKNPKTTWEPLDMSDQYTWEEESTQHTFWLPILMLFAAALISLIKHPVQAIPWKLYMDIDNVYGSFKFSIGVPSFLTMVSWLCLSPIVILFLRTTLFVMTHLSMSQGLWLFPRLLSENTFLGPFYPLFAWDSAPQETLGLKWRRFRKVMLADFKISKPRRGQKSKITKSQLLRFQQN